MIKMFLGALFFIALSAGITFLIYNMSKSEHKLKILKWFFIVSGVVVVGLLGLSLFVLLF